MSSNSSILPNPPSPETRERYVFIDALRGLACTGVLFHHLFFNTILTEPLRTIFPAFITWLAFCGTFGVQIFFVLSGFVIAHSLRNTPLTMAGIGRFILRRQVRLDPPYWLALAVALMMHFVALKVFPGTVSPLPSPGEIALNMIYLQNIFGAEQILIVAWTLCIEVQFYVAFILLLSLAGKLSRKLEKQTPSDATTKNKAVALLVASGGLSFLAVLYPKMQIAFIGYWYYFVAGVLCYWAVRREINSRIFVGFLAAFTLSIVADYVLHAGGEKYNPGFMLVGLASCIAIYAVGIKGKLTTLWNHPLIQYLGRISYSLYLLHWLVVVTVFRIGRKLTGDNPLFAAFYVVLGFALSIGVAHVFYLIVEKPSMKFAARMKKSGEGANAQPLSYESIPPAPTPAEALPTHSSATGTSGASS